MHQNKGEKGNNMFEIFILNSYEEVSKKASEVVLEVLKKDQVTLGLATGSSPVGMYQQLVDAYHKGQSFQHVTSVNLDEYVGINQDHPQSYYTFMFEHLFKHVDIMKENIHIPSGLGNSENSTNEYELFLQAHPQDLQVLGIGSNGHIGFNEPGTAFDSTVHQIELKKETRLDNARFFSSLDEVPTHAITMGIQDIMRAQKIVLIATGQKKAQAIYDCVHAPLSVDIPCTILQKHPHVVLIVDQEAGQLIK